MPDSHPDSRFESLCDYTVYPVSIPVTCFQNCPWLVWCLSKQIEQLKSQLSQVQKDKKDLKSELSSANDRIQELLSLTCIYSDDDSHPDSHFESLCDYTVYPVSILLTCFQNCPWLVWCLSKQIEQLKSQLSQAQKDKKDLKSELYRANNRIQELLSLTCICSDDGQSIEDWCHQH